MIRFASLAKSVYTVCSIHWPIHFSFFDVVLSILKTKILIFQRKCRTYTSCFYVSQATWLRDTGKRVYRALKFVNMVRKFFGISPPRVNVLKIIFFLLYCIKKFTQWTIWPSSWYKLKNLLLLLFSYMLRAILLPRSGN